MSVNNAADVLLINPPSGIFYGLGPNFAPFGLFSLAAVLRQAKISAVVLNANYFPDYHTQEADKYQRPETYYYADDHENPIWEQILNFIDQVSPKLLGFSAHDFSVGGIKRLARAAKERHPEMVMVAGGPTATSEPGIFDDTLEIDYLIAGEGEETIIELARLLKLGSFANDGRQLKEADILGLYYRENGHFTLSGPRPALKDLEALPLAGREYYWLDYARKQTVKDAQLNGIGTSRGCLRACRFCAAKTIWPGPIRFRDIKKVVAEVAWLRKTYGYDFQHFSIFDDDFLARPERVFEFCDLVNNLNDDYRFRCYGRANNLQDEALLEALLQSGCQEIWVGVESGSQKVLDSMGKGITIAQIERVDKLFHYYDFPWLAFIILGTPEEDENDILATLNMLRTGHFPSIGPFTFQPYTGTKFFDLLRAKGRVGYEDIIKGHQNLPQYFSQKVPKERFFELFNQLLALAAERRKDWRANFYLSEDQLAQALELEQRTADFLEQQPKRFLAVGPEQQLRWLAALTHYGNIKAEITFCDLTAQKIVETRFGRFVPPASLKAGDWASLLVVAPAARQTEFIDRGRALFNNVPVTVIGDVNQDSVNNRPFSKLFWRPVSELCRQQV